MVVLALELRVLPDANRRRNLARRPEACLLPLPLHGDMNHSHWANIYLATHPINDAGASERREEGKREGRERERETLPLVTSSACLEGLPNKEILRFPVATSREVGVVYKQITSLPQLIALVPLTFLLFVGFSRDGRL